MTDILVSDTWVSKYGIYEILNDFWNDNLRKKAPDFGQFSFIPLNNFYSKIPG